MQCEGCYFQDKKENVCLHENPFFDIDDNCTNYIENDFIKKIKENTIEECISELKIYFDDDSWCIEVLEELKEKKE